MWLNVVKSVKLLFSRIGLLGVGVYRAVGSCVVFVQV